MKIFERRQGSRATDASGGRPVGIPVGPGVATDHLNLLICGAQRCGTSSLKYYLEEHPEVGFINSTDLVIDGDDVGFPFASPTSWRAMLGENSETYRRIAGRLAGKKAYIGTKQPYFMVQPQVPLNIREHLPDAKCLFVLRNPVDCAYSVYCKGLAKGNRKGSFREHVRLSLDAAKAISHPDERGRWLRYFEDPEQLPFLIDRGFYYPQLKRFYTFLRDDQIDDIYRMGAGAAGPIRAPSPARISPRCRPPPPTAATTG